jgi:nucleotide-binding universal stress UspA family protein
MFKHFLIPTDGSAIATAAAAAGIKLARRLGAKVTAFYAIEELQPVYIEGYVFTRSQRDAFEERARKAAQKRLDAIGRMAKAAGVPFTPLVAPARSPYEGIIAAAKKRKCDVIFMASHGRRGLSRLFMGSVTQKVLSHSTMPVVVFH